MPAAEQTAHMPFWLRCKRSKEIVSAWQPCSNKLELSFLWGYCTDHDWTYIISWTAVRSSTSSLQHKLKFGAMLTLHVANTACYQKVTASKVCICTDGSQRHATDHIYKFMRLQVQMQLHAYDAVNFLILMFQCFCCPCIALLVKQWGTPAGYWYILLKMHFRQSISLTTAGRLQGIGVEMPLLALNNTGLHVGIGSFFGVKIVCGAFFKNTKSAYILACLVSPSWISRLWYSWQPLWPHNLMRSMPTLSA